MNDYFTALARHHRWATDRVLEAVDALDDAGYRRDIGLFFHSMHGTLNHLLVTEGLWFARFAEGHSPTVALDAELVIDRAELAVRLREAVARWEAFIASMPAERYTTRLDYRTMRGADASLPFAPTLGHVFNHGTHHRGQITAALGVLGVATPELDWVYQLQQESKT